MKIIVKPGGLSFIALVLISLTVFVVTWNKKVGTVAEQASARSRIAVNSSATVSGSDGKEMLVNGGFESKFTPYNKLLPTDTLSVTGNIGEMWYDNSGWAKVNVAYDKDTENPHSGLVSQRITVSKKIFGQAQIAQTVAVPVATKLTATVWIRANKPTQGEQVELWLRDNDDHTKIYGHQYVVATTQWQPFVVQGTVSEKNQTVFMVLLKSPMTL